MQNLIKLAAWIAPAFLLALLLILGRLDKHNSKMDVETAQFDKEFAYQLSVSSKINADKKFWIEEQENAEEQIKIAAKEKARAGGKVSQQFDILEKTLKEMENKK